jgi:ABC-type nitrate/sulfonate/bicarbonate transport system substrate-binding protein
MRRFQRRAVSIGKSLYYTRCPVPTATGIALERGMLADVYAGTPYELRDVAELRNADAHYTHSIDRCFREGGGSPPVWARARGADTRLVALTFMDETQAIFVRDADTARSVGDLVGRRIGLPVWPRLVFNFWRFAAEKGFDSALRRHGLRADSVRVVDIVESDDADERAVAAYDGERALRRSPYRSQLRALLDGRIDAMFGKGLELALLEAEARGRIRMLFDVSTSDEIADRVNNSTPRLVTVGSRVIDEDFDAVVRYLQALLRAATWARRHAGLVPGIVARECGIDADGVGRYLVGGYATKLAPRIDHELLATVDIVKSFLVTRRYVERDFALSAWVDRRPLREAQRREADRASAGVSGAAATAARPTRH